MDSRIFHEETTKSDAILFSRLTQGKKSFSPCQLTRLRNLGVCACVCAFLNPRVFALVYSGSVPALGCTPPTVWPTLSRVPCVLNEGGVMEPLLERGMGLRAALHTEKTIPCDSMRFHVIPRGVRGGVRVCAMCARGLRELPESLCAAPTACIHGAVCDTMQSVRCALVSLRRHFQDNPR
jgi:hypothetical protein